MIRNSALVLSIAIVFILSGCESLSNLLVVKVDTDFVVDLPVDISAPLTKTDGPYPFDVTETFKPTDEPDLADYVESITAIDLSTMTATIITVTEPFKLLTGTVSVSGNGESVSWSFTDESIDDGTTLSLANDAGQFDTISSMLSASGELAVSFSGTSNLFAIQFVMQTVLQTVVSADI